MVTVHIRDSDRVYFFKYINDHLKDQSGILSTTTDFYAHIDHNDRSNVSCHLTPWIGEHEWQYEGDVIKLKISEEGKPVSLSSVGVDYFRRITVSHNDIHFLRKFLTEALSYYYTPTSCQQIKIYFSRSKGYWEHFHNTYVQPMNRVYIDPMQKLQCINIIDSFIESKQRYIDFGRPYKLNFMLTGVPGAGKTSLIKAIALKYHRPVYVLNFSKTLTDESFIELMSEIEDDSIILMEDIDSFFVDRESKGINVNFSALLNVMDGTMVKGNGLIMFLTANNPQHLDSALIRPGRIDHVMRFDYPRLQEIREAFKDITGKDDEDSFQSFHKHLKGLRISMSSIVDFLFRYPETYEEHVGELLSQSDIRKDILNDKADKMYV